MNRFALLSLGLLPIIGCDPHPDEPQADNPKIYFTGITKVDENGQALAEGDPTDWRTDDSWTTQEKALFAPNTSFQCGPSDSVEVYQSPNPCKAVFALGFKTQGGLTWRFRIVDENFKLLKEYDWFQPPPNYNLIQFKTEGFPKDTLRVYYQAEKPGCIWRGHGDVLVEN